MVLLLTVEGQVAKEGGQEVHGVHDQNGDVGHLLHALLGGTGGKEGHHGADRQIPLGGNVTILLPPAMWGMHTTHTRAVPDKDHHHK